MFKRFITIITVAALLCSVMSLGFGAYASDTAKIIYGDVDGNGKVDTQDARKALRLASGVELLENAEQFERTDVNFDGYVTVFDARQILRGTIGLVALQPSGAFDGFDGGGLFANEEQVVAVFNSALNKIKVTTDENRYIAASMLKTEVNKLTDLNIKSATLLGEEVSIESIADFIKKELTSEDPETEPVIIERGNTDFSLIPVEDADYVSKLSGSEVFGTKVSYYFDEIDRYSGELTIDIAIPDADVEAIEQSAYSKVLNVENMVAAQESTLMKLVQSSAGETAMRREFKNGVLSLCVELFVDIETSSLVIGDVISYSTKYDSQVYVAESNVKLTKLKDITYTKEYSVEYTNFQWSEN